MTQPEFPSPSSPAPRPNGVWWQRNRLPLVAMVPLAVLAVVTSSFQFITLYLPNEYSRPQRAAGQSLRYHESFTNNRHTYQRDLVITLSALKSSSGIGTDHAAQGATLWMVSLSLEAAPNVPLMDCQVALVDSAGVLYDDKSGQYSTSTQQLGFTQQDRCVPPETPGPEIDFLGNLTPGQGNRPASWAVERTISMPQGRQPAYVRVAWNPPSYALIPVP